MRIDKDELRSQLDIVAILSNRYGREFRPDGARNVKCICPFHDEKTPSLKVEKMRAGNVQRWNCFGCGEGGDVYELIMKLENLDLPGALKWCYEYVNGYSPEPEPPKVRVTKPKPVEPTKGLTLEELAQAKRLPVEYLKKFGVSQGIWKDKPAVVIPYKNTIRYRIDLDGKDKFRWRPGDSAKESLYGEDRLDEFNDSDHILILEGESDAWTAWFNNIPAVGVPGQGMWNSRWAELLNGFERVYVWSEPKATLAEKVCADLPDAKVIKSPDGYKDISEYHLKNDGKDFNRWLASLIDSAEESEVEPTPPSVPVMSKSRNKKPTHDEMRDIFLEDNPDLIFDSSLNEWRLYSKGRWQLIPETKVKDRLVTVLERSKDLGISPTKSVLGSVLEFAQLRASQEDWNKDRNIIVMRNGTLEIDTRTLREHRREDYVTHSIDVDYDPNARCPRLIKVLSDGLGGVDEDTLNMIQEYVGLCLTTEMKYEVCIWIVGPPGSGKSTFIEAVAVMAGERAGTLSLDDIQSRFGMFDIDGKTLLRCTENPSMYVKYVGKINTLISGEITRTERKHKDPVSIYPVCKLLWSMNALPTIRKAYSENEGLFRRLNIVRFERSESEDPDPELKRVLLEGVESPGILNWALDGLERLNKRGRWLTSETSVKLTARYKLDSDVVKLWLEERCNIGHDETCERKLAWKDFDDWCDENNYKPWTRQKFYEQLRSFATDGQTDNGVRLWRGFGLKLASAMP